MFEWVENRLLAKGLNTEPTLAPSLQIKPKKYQPENICDIVFEKAKDLGGTVNTSVYAEAAVRWVL